MMICKPICPHGHDKRLVGIATNRQCRECRQSQQTTDAYNVRRWRKRYRVRGQAKEALYAALWAEVHASWPELAELIGRPDTVSA